MAGTKVLADENFDSRVLRGLRPRLAELDAVRVQDVGLAAAADPVVLAWAAAEGRVLLTHDVTTMTAYAIERVRAGEPMAGVIVVPDRLSVGRAVTALANLLRDATPDQLAGSIAYLSLR